MLFRSRLKHKSQEGNFVRRVPMLVQLLLLAARVAREGFVERSAAGVELERVAEDDQEDDAGLAEDDEG